MMENFMKKILFEEENKPQPGVATDKNTRRHVSNNYSKTRKY